MKLSEYDRVIGTDKKHITDFDSCDIRPGHFRDLLIIPT